MIEGNQFKIGTNLRIINLQWKVLDFFMHRRSTPSIRLVCGRFAKCQMHKQFYRTFAGILNLTYDDE